MAASTGNTVRGGAVGARRSPLGRVGLVGLALTAVVAVAISAAEVAAARASESDALPTDDADLTLADTVGSVLVGFTVGRAGSGGRELLVHLEPSGGVGAAELTARLTVDGRPVALDRCGPTCRRGVAAVAGGDQLEVAVDGVAGGPATFDVPALPPPDGDELVERATQRMNALDSYRVVETLGPVDPPIRARYAIQAPDRLRVTTDDGAVTVRVDDRLYRRRAGQRRWRTRDVPPLDLPNHIWDEPDTEPIAARVIGTDRVDGAHTQIVAFFEEVRDRPIWYRLWIDDDGLVRAAEMLTRGHFMAHRYHAFDQPVTVDPPYGPVAGAAVAVFGDPPNAYWQAGATAARWATFAGLLIAAGAVAFLVVVHDRRPDDRAVLGRLITAAALVAVLATLLAVPLQAIADTGQGPAVLLDPTAWADQLSVGRAGATVFRLGGLTAVVTALPRLWQPAAMRWATAGALVALASLLPTGHTATADPRWLALVADYTHTAAAAGWVGGLMALLVTLRLRRLRAEPLPAPLVAAFSRFALACVTMVVVAGGVLAWIQLGGLGALADEVYGGVLTAKLAVVAAVLTIAAYNRWWLLPALHLGDDQAWTRLRRTVAAEGAGLLAVMAVTAALVNVTPPT